MASTREERMQQRLRGAQKRQVKDVDFELDFAALVLPPPAAAVLTRRSPRRSLGLAPQSSTRSTPANTATSQPPTPNPQDENIPPTVSPSVLAPNFPAKHANTSAKRRKLGADESSTSIRSAVSSFPEPRRDIYALEEDEQPASNTMETTNSSVEQAVSRRQVAEADIPTLVIPQNAAKSPTPTLGEVEITESPTHAPGSGLRIRIVNQASLPDSRLRDELQAGIPPGSPTPQRKRKRATSNDPRTTQSRRSRRTSINEASHKANEPEEVDELSPDQPKRGRRRRSSIQRQSLSSTVREESPEERESAEEIDDVQAAAILRKNRGRRISRRAGAEPSPDLDEPEEIMQAAGKRRRTRPQPTSTPAIHRHPKNMKQKAKASKKLAKKKMRSGSPIPVTVHRLTNGPTYEADESDADILNSEIPYSRRGGVNVIDVLNKLCTEIIDLALETLKDNIRNTEDHALKREYRIKHKAVETFSGEFQNRLVEHTINLDNTSALEKRFREEQKKKFALREEILRLRGERQKIALRMDGVRITHEQESKDAQDQDTLNTAIHDIELAVERGKEKNPHDASHGPVEKVGVELLLQRVAGDVSNKSVSGGMLKQIKDFNAFLERTALVLEGRKA